MALIKCSDCGKEISSDAASCIYCGKPLKEIPQTIEQTSKKWKRLKLISWFGLVTGFIVFGGGLQNGGFDNTQTGLGLFIGLISFVSLMIGKFGAWWNNK